MESSKDQMKDYRKISKDIMKIKKKQEAAWDSFIENKNKFLKANKELKNQVAEFTVLESKLNQEKVVHKKKKEAKEKEALKKEAKKAEEKFKKKGKLTTEDIIKLQGGN